MIETAVATGHRDAESAGLAVLDNKGELSRAAGLSLRPGAVLDVGGLGPHVQAGDVDFQVCYDGRGGGGTSIFSQAPQHEELLYTSRKNCF